MHGLPTIIARNTAAARREYEDAITDGAIELATAIDHANPDATYSLTFGMRPRLGSVATIDTAAGPRPRIGPRCNDQVIDALYQHPLPAYAVAARPATRAPTMPSPTVTFLGTPATFAIGKPATIASVVYALGEAGVDGATLHEATGVWKGETEPTVVVQVAGLSYDRAAHLAARLAYVFAQEAVYLAWGTDAVLVGPLVSV